MDLELIQSALREAGLDAWLFYDHHHRDPIAYRVLKLHAPLCTRRWYYLIPAQGAPAKLVHRVERSNLDTLPGTRHLYSSWQEQREQLGKILGGKKRIAMQYSPLNDIPYVGLVDAGTVELVKGFGVEVVSSGDLVQWFEARWPRESLESHLSAGKVVHGAVRRGFALIRDTLRAGKTLNEYDVQQEILRFFDEHGVTTEETPIAAVNANTANPHYCPTAEVSQPIRENDFVLLDVWGKLKKPGSVYFDITWTGFVGEDVPSRYASIFAVVREARDAAVSLIQEAMQQGKPLHGCEVDDAARAVINGHDLGEYFIHRTGHSIGEDIHGNGANMDNFETHDSRRIVPGTCFSVEPGIYLQDFGVRSEVNVYVEERGARVTGEKQEGIVPIFAQDW